MLASFALMTACELSGLPKTLRCEDHLVRKESNDGHMIIIETYLKHSSTICRWAERDVAVTIHRS